MKECSMKQRTIWLLGSALVVAGLIATGAFNTGGPTTAPSDAQAMITVVVPASLSASAQAGQSAFDATCAACHGSNAAGLDGIAPPLVHKIYEPSHHADYAFEMAITLGVRAHHWRFGDMPAQTGVSQTEAQNIIVYVRELQRANGIL